MQTQNRTFRLDKLYHQFLKPKGVNLLYLDVLATQLHLQGFIQITGDRYTETEKLTSRQHRDELFKIIEGMKHD